MYKSLQGGRAIAAILVVLYHLGLAVSSEKYFGIDGIKVPFSFGFSGVNFFFVLSGFIIYHAHFSDLSNPKRVGNYLIKRAIRIYPTYWIAFFSVWALALLSPYTRAVAQLDAATLFKSAALIPQADGAPILAVAWTLQFEVVFYVAFACAIISRTLGVIILNSSVEGEVSRGGHGKIQASGS